MDIVNKFIHGVSEIFSENRTESQSYTPFNNHEVAYLIAQSFLLLLTFVNIIWIIVVFVVLRKNKHFHTNLISLMVFMLIVAILYFICRIILIFETFVCYQTCYDVSPYMFSRKLFYIDFAKIFFGCAYLSTLPCIIAERAHATVLLRIYEKFINYNFIITCIFIQLFFGAFFTIIMYKEVVNMIFIVATSELVSLVFSFAFFGFDRINQKLYKISKTKGSNCELSERYQLAENIKTAKLMKNSIIAYAIFNANIMIMFFLVFWLENPNYKKWVQFVYEIEISIYAIILPVIAIMSVETWKNVFTKTFKKLFKSTNVNPSNPSENLAIGGIPEEHLEHIKSSNGEKIVFKLDQEGEIYFNQLQKAWG